MFTNEEFFKELNMLLDLQLQDLTLALECGADILCLVGCFNLIEFMGGIRNSKLGKTGYAECRFKEGIRLLGGKWAGDIKVNDIPEDIKELLGDKVRDRRWEGQNIGEDAMWELRNAITHQYIAEAKESRPQSRTFPMIAIDGSRTTWYFDRKALSNSSHLLPISIRELVDVIKTAGDKLIGELESNEAQRNKANEQLYKLPRLKRELPNSS